MCLFIPISYVSVSEYISEDILFFPHFCFNLQVRLLCVATQYGDRQSVCYLLKEACIPVPLEPSNSNPAVLAAHYGHTDLVKELLDHVPGRSTAYSPTFILCGYIDSLCIILVLIIHYKMNDHQQRNVGHLVLNRTMASAWTTFQIYTSQQTVRLQSYYHVQTTCRSK